jgi:hypothetical protein
MLLQTEAILEFRLQPQLLLMVEVLEVPILQDKQTPGAMVVEVEQMDQELRKVEAHLLLHMDMLEEQVEVEQMLGRVEAEVVLEE